MGDEVEARAECVCDHLHRPDHPDWKLTDAKVRSTGNQTVPDQRKPLLPASFAGPKKLQFLSGGLPTVGWEWVGRPPPRWVTHPRWEWWLGEFSCQVQVSGPM